MPSIEDLALTVSALKLPNFSLVAAQHHVSQSTVSRSVQRVEAALGYTLFDRSPRAKRVTDSGVTDSGKVRPHVVSGSTIAVAQTGQIPTSHSQAAIRQSSPTSTSSGSVQKATRISALELLESMLASWESLRTLHQPSQATLRIFCTVTASQSFAADLLTTFRRTHPSVLIDLRTGPASAALDAARLGEVDAAIAPLPARLPSLMVAVPLTTTPLVAVAGPDVDVPEGWRGIRLVLPQTGLTRALVNDWIRKSLPVNHTITEASTHEEVLALSSLGSGVGIVPSLVVESSALKPRLRILPPPAPLPTMALGMCALQSATETSPLRELWAMLSER
jgi:LysR family transcriptional regulator, positive regulator for ilvC